MGAERLDAKTHRPANEPFPVYHLHSSRRSMSNISLSMLEVGVAPGRIVFAQGEVSGNIWLVRTQSTGSISPCRQSAFPSKIIFALHLHPRIAGLATPRE